MSFPVSNDEKTCPVGAQAYLLDIQNDVKICPVQTQDYLLDF